ncbi:MAG TPA: serpin family protein [Acidobacteriota bacterium]|nr:serpin family protein [Acidobacteriota bacterium]
MKKIIALLISILIMLFILAGCAQPVTPAEQKSGKARETSPSVSQPELDRLAEGNTTFALDLFQLLKEQDGNFFYSPYSISQALAMTYGGMRGETEKQTAAALQFRLGQEQLHAAFNRTDIDLNQRGQGAKGADGKGFRLNVVNAIWGRQGYQFTREYLDLLARNYGAGLRIVDYQAAPEQSRRTINQWVADQTENRIKDLLPQGSITSLTRLVLTNAIYFNAAWANRFEKAATQEGRFTLLNGDEVSLPMMKQYAENYRYTEGDGYQAIELPYDGREISMIIILPGNGQHTSVESGLDYAKLNSLPARMKNAAVDLSLPKFRIETALNLNAYLKKLGMTDAFDPNKADLSGMNGNKELFISDVVHKAFVAVDEAGTEAAAATGVVAGITSMPTDIKQFTVDRPFIFLIRDNPTGTVLFLGRVLNPLQ